MARALIPQLPPPQVLAQLPEKQLALLLEHHQKQTELLLKYANTGMRMGFIALIACIAGTTFLIYTGHPTGAAFLLGASVLNLVGQFIRV